MIFPLTGGIVLGPLYLVIGGKKYALPTFFMFCTSKLGTVTEKFVFDDFSTTVLYFFIIFNFANLFCKNFSFARIYFNCFL